MYTSCFGFPDISTAAADVPATSPVTSPVFHKSLLTTMPNLPSG